MSIVWLYALWQNIQARHFEAHKRPLPGMMVVLVSMNCLPSSFYVLAWRMPCIIPERKALAFANEFALSLWCPSAF